MRLAKLLLSLIVLSSIVRSQREEDDPDGGDIDVEDVGQIFQKDLTPEQQKSGVPYIQIRSIFPNKGPMSGKTHVLVQTSPIEVWAQKFKKPKCKFGDIETNAAYASCQITDEKEEKVNEKANRNIYHDNRCIYCEGSPAILNETSVAFQVSLTGDFSDSLNSVEFRYYPEVHIAKIYPRYGPIDGQTPVQVYGSNFRKYDDGDNRCGFGTVSVPATVINDTYLECMSPQSDVSVKPIPFTITQNAKQFSVDTMYYWYYNFPSIEEILPHQGPESGGTEITVKGKNFAPFEGIESQIDNKDDVYCGFFDLNLRVRAKILNATRAICISPPSYYVNSSLIEITLNGVDYTSAQGGDSKNNRFNYYKPPYIYDVDPREGPVKGGTVITIKGTQFQNTGENIKCDFGGYGIVEGNYKNSQEITCVAPQAYKPSRIDLRLAVVPELWSNPIKFLYYETPIVKTVQPQCGPETGFTQIELTGTNFVDLGSNKAMCIFNKTIFTNATVFSDTTLFCDSPQFLNQQGYSLVDGDNDWYDVSITMDGGVEVVNTGIRFTYYKEPTINGVFPFGGPLKGQTPVVLNITGNMKSACLPTIRFSTYELVPVIVTDGQLKVIAPPTNYPGTTVVQISFNGQQYTEERIHHIKDPQASYEYYKEPIITFHHPAQGPSVGGTKLKIQGQGFQTFKPQRDADQRGPVQAPNRIWLRMLDKDTGNVLHQEELQDFRNDELSFATPAMNPGVKALIQISRNSIDWNDVKDPKSAITQSFTYYPSPHIQKISPSFGPVKPTGNQTLVIQGTDFVCPNSNCKNVKCRFQDRSLNSIYTSCKVISQTQIEAQVPKYTKPDVLEVEIAMNGLDFTNDNKTYGYYDPYVIDAQPRLISVKGDTQVTLTGLGFVDSGEIKTKFTDRSEEIECSGNACVQNAKFLDANRIVSGTVPQSQLVYKKTKEPVEWNPFQVVVSVYSDQFTDNNIILHYYREPSYTLLCESETPANIKAELLVGVTIHSDDLENLKKHGDAKCRFTGAGHVLYTDGIFVHSTKGPNGLVNQDPNSIRCVTPIWPYGSSQIKLDFTLNGQDYAGKLDFKFSGDLVLHRVVPMAGPLNKAVKDIRLFGEGFKPLDPQLEFQSKWGILSTSYIHKAQVSTYRYKLQDFLQVDNDSQELKCYQYEATNFKRVDSQIQEGMDLDSYKVSDEIPQSILQQEKYQIAEVGGAFYLQVGRNVIIDNYNIAQGASRRLQDMAEPATNDSQKLANQTQTQQTNQTEVKSAISSQDEPKAVESSQVKQVTRQPPKLNWSTESYTYYEYNPTSVEFYHYKQCTMVSIHPSHGLSTGNTAVSVSGYDFRYWPEWGVVPHCRFGDQVVRGYFDSTVRIVCQSPQNELAQENIPFEVSLNGHDWTQTGFTYSYYKEPKILSYFPDSGQSAGGTFIYVKGENFPRFFNTREFNARFTPQSGKMDAKIVPVEWLNSTTLKIMTPGGWSQGDTMDFQITFNGEDYDKNHFEFTFFNVAKVRPRSGPADGLGGDIIITGQGFTKQPLCRLNHTVYQPTNYTQTEIRCPIVAAEQGPDFFGSVDFAISVNKGSDWHVFPGGFQYYQQPIVVDIDPKNGPAHGVGVINFYGSGFKDFALADLQCKIGTNIGVAVPVSGNQIRCIVEDMDLVAEGQRLPAQVALNGYSWTQTNDNVEGPGEIGSTFYVPYSVNAIFPNSGRATGDTEVLVIGSGFFEEPHFKPRCKFGVPTNYAITDAQIINYNKLVCKSPPMPSNKQNKVLPIDIPFSLALTQDQFSPWTETHHKFRYYQSPVINEVYPLEVQVGTITEVIATIQSADVNNAFFEPYPAEAGKFDLDTIGNEAVTAVASGLLMGNYIKCKFGRFGETLAVYVNQTTIKCVTPSVLDDPDSIYQEKVQFSIAMNGYDYDYDANNFEFTFIGTGSVLGFGLQTLVILLLGILLIAVIMFVQNYFIGYQPVDNSGPYTHSGNGDNVEPNMVLRYNPRSASNQLSLQSRAASRGQSMRP